MSLSWYAALATLALAAPSSVVAVATLAPPRHAATSAVAPTARASAVVARGGLASGVSRVHVSSRAHRHTADPLASPGGQDPPAAGATRSFPERARAWSWPIDPRPAILRPFDRPAQRWSPGHRGVDLAAGRGAVVRTPEAGIVAYVGVVAGRPVVSVDHASGLRSTFEPVIADQPVGAAVARGDPIGRLDTGSAHCASTSCLHWGVKRGKDYLDPLALVVSRSPILLPLR